MKLNTLELERPIDEPTEELSDKHTVLHDALSRDHHAVPAGPSQWLSNGLTLVIGSGMVVGVAVLFWVILKAAADSSKFIQH